MREEICAVLVKAMQNRYVEFPKKYQMEVAVGICFISLWKVVISDVARVMQRGEGGINTRHVLLKDYTHRRGPRVKMWCFTGR